MADPHLILITGASGEVGSFLYETLTKAGHTCVRAGRSSGRNYSLTADPAVDLLKGVKTVIHCAYDFTAAEYEDSYKVNVLGTRDLCEAIAASEVQHFILVSSGSANESAASIYGRIKFETELCALQYQKSTVVRVGLIGGDQPMGPFAFLVKLAKRFRIAIVLSPDEPIFSYIDSGSMATLFESLVNSPPLGGPYSSSKTQPLVTLESALRTAVPQKLYALPISSSLCFHLLRLKESLFGIRGLRSDSVKSMSSPPVKTPPKSIWENLVD